MKNISLYGSDGRKTARLTNRIGLEKTSNPSSVIDGASDAFNMSGLNASLTDSTSNKAPPQKSKSPAAFLGENSNLVNLDNLVSAKQVPSGLGKEALASPQVRLSYVKQSSSLH